LTNCDGGEPHRRKETETSVAFTKEDSTETASETLLPNRSISPV
jgi:hypothetical protein